MFEVLPFVWDSAAFELPMPHAIASCKDPPIFEDLHLKYMCVQFVPVRLFFSMLPT